MLKTIRVVFIGDDPKLVGENNIINGVDDGNKIDGVKLEGIFK